MKFSPMGDSGWQEFGEYHRDFLESCPNLDKEIEYDFRLLAELRTHCSINQNVEENTPEEKNTRVFVSTRYLINPGEAHLTVNFPYGDTEFIVSWKVGSEQIFQEPCLTFSWHGNANNPHQLLVILLSSDTLLPLAEPLPLGPAWTDSSRELPVDIVDPTQPLAFRLILSRVEIAQQSPPQEAQMGKVLPFIRLTRAHSRNPELRERLQSKASPSIPSLRTAHSGYDSIPFRFKSAAGSSLAPEPIQELPREWFPGKSISLEFKDFAGWWKIRLRGTLDELMLTFWSVNGERMGEPLCAGPEFKELPIRNFLDIVGIDVASLER